MKFIFNQKCFDREELIQKIINFIKVNHIKDYDFGSSLRKNGNWAKLGVSIFGSHDYRSILHLKSIWERDQETIKSSVINSFAKCLKFTCSKYEWECFKQKYLQITSTGRRKFSASFSNELNERLRSNREFNLNCNLSHSHNWFSNKMKSHIWKGVYVCSECKNKFIAIVNKVDIEDVFFDLIYNSSIEMHDFVKNEKLRGKLRENIQTELLAKNYDLLMLEKKSIFSYSDDNEEKKIKRKLAKAKSECVLIDRMSNRMSTDIEAVKKIYDTEYPFTKINKLYGLIQEISLQPFGFLVLSEMQVNIWKIVKDIKPIWYFDAAGSFLQNVEEQNRPLLYSIVMHDPTNKLILPLVEFHTTRHSTNNIEGYLRKVKNMLQENISINYLPKIIVVDFSWANIDAVVVELMCTEMKSYLIDCFDYVVGSNSKLKNSPKIYLCCVHILKKMARDFDGIYKSIKKESKMKLRSSFLYCFSLLQNSVTLVDFEKNLFHIFYILTSKYVTKNCITAFGYVRQSINQRFLAKFKNKFIETNFDDEEIEKKLRKAKDTDLAHLETVESLRESSPFNAYFNKKLCEFAKQISTDNENENAKLNNAFYAPNLFNKIKDILHIMPLWSGVMIKEHLEEMGTTTVSRETNNIVENWFNQLRNNILKISKREKAKRRLMPSQLIASEFKYIKKKYQDFYEKSIETQKESKRDLKNSINSSNSKNSKQKAFKEMKENWRDGITKTTGLRNKGVIYKNPSNVFRETLDEKTEKEIKELVDLNFDQIFDINNLYENEKSTAIQTNKDILLCLKLINGGVCNFGDTTFVFQNTCSIDHFLFVLHLIFKKKQNLIQNKMDQKLFNCVKEISLSLDRNDWNMARYLWIVFNSPLQKYFEQINLFSSNKQIFNFFMNEYESFLSFYGHFQEYSWKYVCSSHSICLCPNHKEKQTSSFYYELKPDDNKIICQTKLTDKEESYCANFPLTENDGTFILDGPHTCSGIIRQTEKRFKKPIILIVSISGEIVELNDIPKNISIFETNYQLIGVSVFIEELKHYFFKLNSEDTFYNFDNLNLFKKQDTSSKFSKNYALKMSRAFYEIIL